VTTQQTASSVVSELDSEPPPGRSLLGILLHGSQSSWHPPGRSLHGILTAAGGRGMYSTDSIINRREGERAPPVTEALGAPGVAFEHSICQQQVQAKHWNGRVYFTAHRDGLAGQTGEYAEERFLKSSSLVELHPESLIYARRYPYGHVTPCLCFPRPGGQGPRAAVDEQHCRPCSSTNGQ
jgi:hypothetical protein